jgi:hypothetical protein
MPSSSDRARLCPIQPPPPKASGSRLSHLGPLAPSGMSGAICPQMPVIVHAYTPGGTPRFFDWISKDE